MQIAVYENLKKTQGTNAAEKLSVYLSEKGFDTIVVSDYASLKNVDVLIVLGGDGTLLKVAKAVAKHEIKIIGINYGTLGFLAQFEKDESEELSKLLFEIKSGTQKDLHRTLLEIKHQDKTFYALNEASVLRDFLSINSNMLKLKVRIGNEDGREFSGDGAIVCTPTGSTAYSLSAGGAIIEPNTKVFMLTPVCAFSFNARPIVFSDDLPIEVEVLSDGAVLLADGKAVEKIEKGDKIFLKKADFTANFPQRNNSEFFEKVWKKLI